MYFSIFSSGSGSGAGVREGAGEASLAHLSLGWRNSCHAPTELQLLRQMEIIDLMEPQPPGGKEGSRGDGGDRH